MTSLRNLLFTFLCCSTCMAQDRGLTEMLKPLYSGNADAINARWDELRKAGSIPLVINDSVAFLFRQEAKSVQWTGDFNGWEYDKAFNNHGAKIPGTDIWVLKASFPITARLDYKLIVDSQWILDPENQQRQLSGVGGGSPNSELRMPGWVPDPFAKVDPAIAKGELREDVLFTSKELGYQITYSLYVPHGVTPDISVPILYVTDGYEYLHPQMGNMKVILDNLIGGRKIQPVMVVFVDNRDPINRSNNKRMAELAMNEKYLNFFVRELIPAVEPSIGGARPASQRGILGTSMGGLAAAYFAFSRPDIFGLAGIQSPAFWFRPEIYTFCDNAEKPPVKIFLTTGLFFDNQDGARKMKSILEKNTCTFQFQEVNQGHSWGQWKDLIDEILIYFYAQK